MDYEKLQHLVSNKRIATMYGLTSTHIVQITPAHGYWSVFDNGSGDGGKIKLRVTVWALTAEGTVGSVSVHPDDENGTFELDSEMSNYLGVYHESELPEDVK